MTVVFEAGIAALLVIAGVFGLIGSYGLLRLRTPMQRLHAPTKASTLGVAAAVLGASGADWLRTGTPGVEEFLIVAFLFLTAPVTAHFLAQVHLHRNRTPDAVPGQGEGPA